MIGYPDHPTNYTYDVSPDTYGMNSILSNAFDFQSNLAKVRCAT